MKWVLWNPIGSHFCYMTLDPCEHLVNVCSCSSSCHPPVLKYQVTIFKEDEADIEQQCGCG